MKRIFFVSAIMMSSLALLAQTAKPKTTPTTKTNSAAKTNNAKAVTPAPVLKNAVDSLSYALGISLASYYKTQGIKELNSELLSKATGDMLKGNPTLMDNNAAGAYLNNYMTKLQGEKSKATKEAGEKYLAANKTREGVKVTESGLQYEVLQEGTGEKPGAVDTVTCHYRGTFIDGKGFDNSYDRGQPISFPLNGVIKGWTEGLQLMSVGSKYKFYIPYTLGYGEYDYMSIPGGSALVFEVELIDIKRTK
ncbi:MAG: FKBP-type peptidyl-prolyl cis-trans isomerase [Chitinophagaceae bacterium]|jgi:FKBP-type peptidyl-prolyl cis-trans isomerase